MQATRRPPLDEVIEVHESLITHAGETTADGNVGGTTLIDATLIGTNNFVTNKTILILSGARIRETRTASGFNPATGQITVAPAFTGQVLRAVKFFIMGGTGGGGGGAVSSMTPVSNVVAANWNSGVATSGLAGADLVTIGANDTNAKLWSAIVSIRALTPAAVITIRMYMQVNGVADQVYIQQFIQGTDPNGCWIVNGVLGIHEALRIEVFSSVPGDDARNVFYDYLIET